MRFSDLERAIPNITQKMLGQQLRSLAVDGIVVRLFLNNGQLSPCSRGTALIIDRWHGGHGHEAEAQFQKKTQQ